MNPKRIGFLGFDGVTSLHFVGPADTFVSAALDGGYGSRIPCYQICTIGLTPEPFRAESGIIFEPEETLETAPELDTVVVPGGEGLRRDVVGAEGGGESCVKCSEGRKCVAQLLRVEGGCDLGGLLLGDRTGSVGSTPQGGDGPNKRPDLDKPRMGKLLGAVAEQLSDAGNGKPCVAALKGGIEIVGQRL